MRRVIVATALVLGMAGGVSSGRVQGAQTAPTATLTAACTPTSAPRGVDTLITCRYEATNEGPGMLSDASIAFVPAANVPPPGRYFFFSEKLDGAEVLTSGSDTLYGLGDIAEGATRVLTLGIIVRATERFGAQVQLLGAPSQNIYATTSSVYDVSAARPAVSARVTLDPGQTVTGSTALYTLALRNEGTGRLTNVEVTVHPVDNAGVTNIGGGSDFGKTPANYTTSKLADLAPGATVDVPIWYESRSPCASPYPALIGTADAGGTQVEFAALAEETLVVNCASGYGLPESGTGPGRRRGFGAAAAGLMAAGLITIVTGGVVRWRVGRPAR